jgi:hypothetical protein
MIKGVVNNLNSIPLETGARGVAVDEALRYKPEGCNIESQWRDRNFSLT